MDVIVKHLCEECLEIEMKADGSMKPIKDFSFGLHNCSNCGRKIPTKECLLIGKEKSV